MDDKKSKILIILGTFFLIFVLGVIIYFLYFYDFSSPRVTEKEEEEKEQVDMLPDDDPEPPREDLPEDIDYSEDRYSFDDKDEIGEADLQRMTSSFVERFGSYSSHSGFDNINDLRGFMSQEMRDWASRYIQDSIDVETEDNDFYSIETRALVTNVDELDKEAGRALVVVDTRRVEMRDDEESIINQSIEISYTKENGHWRVSRAEWQ